MYVTQETESLQNPPFGSIIDDEPIYTTLCNAVTTVELEDSDLVMFKAKMTVYGVIGNYVIDIDSDGSI
jgi:hypothetical protein